jgi:hypothetical protein
MWQNPRTGPIAPNYLHSAAARSAHDAEDNSISFDELVVINYLQGLKWPTGYWMTLLP